MRRDGRPHIAHRWVPDPEVAPRVRLAFEMKAAGKNQLEIHNATRLYGSRNSYTTFFTNKLYIGVLEFGDLVIEDYCMPIVDRWTWDAVQALARQHAETHGVRLQSPRHPRRTNSQFLLSGLAFCARCGAPLYGLKRGGGHRSYACTRASRTRTCDLKPIPASALETAVLSALQDYILTPAVLAAHQEYVSERQQEAEEQFVIRRHELGVQLAGLRRQIANVAAAIAEVGHSRAMLEKLAALEADETLVRSQIAELERQAEQPDPAITEEQLAVQADTMLAILQGEDLSAAQSVLRGLITKIGVERDGTRIFGHIEYYYPPTRDPPETETVSTGRISMGAPLRRHSFTYEFVGSLRAWHRRS